MKNIKCAQIWTTFYQIYSNLKNILACKFYFFDNDVDKERSTNYTCCRVSKLMDVIEEANE